MSNPKELPGKEIQVLVQSLNRHLITLADSLKGRLSPAERTILADLFQVQIELQKSLMETLSGSAVPPSSMAPDDVGSEREVDNIAYAQAMEYARDLVKAIQQKKEQQRRLELTSQQLIRAEKLATIGHVSATVAHELGNILTPLLMYAKLIYEEAATDPESELAEFATQISQIAHRASHMLRQLVDAARSEQTMMIPVNLTQIIDNTLGLLSPQIKKQGINVQKYYPEKLPLVMGRPDQLEQVFINIGLNAFDAMPKGGDFTVRLEAGHETINQFLESDFITIYLGDTGVGILPENISLLFEPFYTTKERGAGSGLGLFVSYLIIDQHGGTIEVESEPKIGTTFMVKLPTANKR